MQKSNLFARYIHFFFCFLIIGIIPAFSQTQPGPCFEASITRGCAPLTIQVINCSSDGTQIGYDYGDGNFTNTTSFTYTTPGKYTVRQIGNFESSNGGDTLTRVAYIEVLSTPPPTFEISTCEGRTVDVTITDTNYDLYLVEFGDGISQAVTSNSAVKHTYPDVSQRTITVSGQHITQPAGQTCAGSSSNRAITPIEDLIKPTVISLIAVNTSTLELTCTVNNYLNYKILQKTGANGNYQEIESITHPATNMHVQVISSVDLSSQLYSFQVVAIDVCGNELASDEISSLLLTATAVNNRNELSWQILSSTQLQGYTVYRDNLLLVQITDPNQTTYIDDNVACPNEYCYQIRAQYSTTTQSIYTQSCVRAISNIVPPPVQYLTASVEQGIIRLNWHLKSNQEVQEFTIFRAENGGEFRELARTQDSTYADIRGNPLTAATSYCYRIVYTNTCGNTSTASTDACPMLLIPSTTSTSIQLNWTAYREWPGGIQEYILEHIDEQGNLLSSQSAEMNLNFQFNSQIIDTTRQVIRFRVKANPVNNFIISSYSTVAEVIQPVQIHFPEAFTPNGDGLNDIFSVKGLFIDKYALTIYNRWGEVVYQTTSEQQGWDGMYKNEIAPPGKYAFTATVEDFTGRNYSKTGTIQLIR